MAFLPFPLSHSTQQLGSSFTVIRHAHVFLRQAPGVMRRPVHVDRSESLEPSWRWHQNGSAAVFQMILTTVITAWCFLAALSAAIALTKLYRSD